jgi:hypothetical protein
MIIFTNKENINKTTIFLNLICISQLISVKVLTLNQIYQKSPLYYSQIWTSFKHTNFNCNQILKQIFIFNKLSNLNTQITNYSFLGKGAS